MKLPNGFGSVYKPPGNRRNPYRAIVTEHWQIDTQTSKWKQKRKTIGYYKSKKEALQSLADYNKSPYDVDAPKVTFQEVYERWFDVTAAKTEAGIRKVPISDKVLPFFEFMIAIGNR